MSKACPGGRTGTSHAPLRQTRGGRFAGARVPPMHYLDKPLQQRVGGSKTPNPGVQFLMTKRVQFRTSVDNGKAGSSIELGKLSLG
jgi:hypothetical protein